MTSPRLFKIGIYKEHLEETSFLVDQRRTLFRNPTVSWPRIGEFEDRIEAHIDALVVGADLALEVCRKQAVEGDAGELNAALRVFCRQKHKDLLQQTLDTLDVEDPDKVLAAAEALSHEFPADWGDVLKTLLSRPDGKFIGLVARIEGHKRLGKGDDLVALLPKAPPAALPHVCWALGRMRSAASRPVMVNICLKHEDPAVRSAALWALLRLGEPLALAHCQEVARAQNEVHVPLALCGGRSALDLLLGCVKPGHSAETAIFALGLLGHTLAIPPLIDVLERGEHPEAVARALHMITGATLMEEAFIPENVDQDELFEHEKKTLAEGKPLLGPDGKPRGATVQRVSQNAKQWKEWWLKQDRFNARIRFRFGRAITPGTLIDAIEGDLTPFRLRKLAHDELVIRYGCDFPFEPDMPVPNQQRAIASMRQWHAANNAPKIMEGVWFYAGRPSGSLG